MKKDVVKRGLTCFLATLVCQACLADYPESWHVGYKPDGVNEQPYISRNLVFDAWMEGLSYNNMVSGTATEFTILTDITENNNNYNGPVPWTDWRITSVRVKIDGRLLALNLSELNDPLENTDYNRRIRWATNEFPHDSDVDLVFEIDGIRFLRSEIRF